MGPRVVPVGKQGKQVLFEAVVTPPPFVNVKLETGEEEQKRKEPDHIDGLFPTAISNGGEKTYFRFNFRAPNRPPRSATPPGKAAGSGTVGGVLPPPG
jgi:hypothetical protein